MSVAFERSMAARAHLQAGFTLVELIIAALVVALVMSAVLASASLAQATYRVHAEAADMDQRTRVLVHALQHDLALAGAGLDQGPLAGALTESFVPILPRAIGTDGPEAATASAITVRYVPAGSPQTTILDDLAGGASAVRVATDGVCPAADPVCGFSAGMQVAVFDGSGAYRSTDDRGRPGGCAALPRSNRRGHPPIGRRRCNHSRRLTFVLPERE